MDRELIERVGSGVGIVVALGVGMLLGGRFCGPELEEIPAVELQECPPMTPCYSEYEPITPNDSESRQPPIAEAVEVDTVKGVRRLPPSPEVHDPAARRQLLAFVRDNSKDLSECRTRRGEPIRSNVVFTFSEDGTIRRVEIQAGPNELPAQVNSCLRTHMLKWQLPAELVQGRERLMFLLTI